MLPVSAVHACSLVASCLLVNAEALSEAVVAVAWSQYTFNDSKVGYVVLSRFMSHDVTITVKITRTSRCNISTTKVIPGKIHMYEHCILT